MDTADTILAPPGDFGSRRPAVTLNPPEATSSSSRDGPVRIPSTVANGAEQHKCPETMTTRPHQCKTGIASNHAESNALSTQVRRDVVRFLSLHMAQCDWHIVQLSSGESCPSCRTKQILFSRELVDMKLIADFKNFHVIFKSTYECPHLSVLCNGNSSRLWYDFRCSRRPYPEGPEVRS